jgi:hypothetical protein
MKLGKTFSHFDRLMLDQVDTDVGIQQVTRHQSGFRHVRNRRKNASRNTRFIPIQRLQTSHALPGLNGRIDWA